MNKKLLIVLLGFIFLLSLSHYVMAEEKESHCISDTTPRYGKGVVCSDGTLLTDNQYCSWRIDPRAGDTHGVVVEVVQGGRYDAGRNLYINYGDTLSPTTLDLWADSETLPMYIYCYKTSEDEAQDGSKGWIKEDLLDQRVIAFDSANSPFPEVSISKSINTLSDNLYPLRIALNQDINSAKTYTNISNESLTSKWLLGLLFAFLGMLLFFDSFFNDRFVRYI